VEAIGNITDEAVQKYIKGQAEESRKEELRSTAFYRISKMLATLPLWACSKGSPFGG
jgi:hypothetical protein